METMKQSGVQWIGEIPQDWNTKRIKYVANLKGRIGWQGLTSNEYQDDGAYLITGVDFSDGGIDWENCAHIPMKRWEEAKDIQIQNGDLLITKDGTIGKVAIVTDMPGETSLNSGVLRIMPIEGHSHRFLYWVLKSDEFWNWFNFRNAGNSTIIHLYQGDFAEFLYAFPNYEEQEAIADFLDENCGKLDTTITAIEEQIDILQNYKISLIKETVTKGLDKTTPTKDSGIQWVGKIPINWKIKKIKHCMDVIGSGTTPESGNDRFYGGDYPWIQSGDLYKKSKIETTTSSITEYAVKEYPALRFYQRDFLVIAMYGASVGNVAISNISAYVNQACCVLKPNKDFDLQYLYYWLFICKEDFIASSFGGGQPNISQQIIKNQYVLQPTIYEQKEISNFLDRSVDTIETIINSKQNQVNTLLNYKKSIIFEYVTGKKRIKEVK